MQLVITGRLPLEHQEIEISDEAQIALCLPDGTTLRLRPRPATGSAYHRIEIMATTSIAFGELLLQPISANVIELLIQASQVVPHANP